MTNPQLGFGQLYHPFATFRIREIGVRALATILVINASIWFVENRVEKQEIWAVARILPEGTTDQNGGRGGRYGGWTARGLLLGF